jgi:hypothetical protein
MRSPHLKWHPRLCPVCGFWDYDVDAHGPRARSGRCPCCLFAFGLTDAQRGFTVDEWRRRWVDEGMCFCDGPEPEDRWDPVKQMMRGGIESEILDELGL